VHNGRLPSMACLPAGEGNGGKSHTRPKVSASVFLFLFPSIPNPSVPFRGNDLFEFVFAPPSDVSSVFTLFVPSCAPRQSGCGFCDLVAASSQRLPYRSFHLESVAGVRLLLRPAHESFVVLMPEGLDAKLELAGRFPHTRFLRASRDVAPALSFSSCGGPGPLSSQVVLGTAGVGLNDCLARRILLSVDRGAVAHTLFLTTALDT
jgi:hypothetical protein